MNDLAVLLAAFEEATRCSAAVWHDQDGAELRLEAASTSNPSPPPRAALVASQQRAESPRGPILVAPVAGPRGAWLVVGPCLLSDATPNAALETNLRFLLPVIGQFRQSALEVEHAANELAERYEEINLLYTISEILGRTVTLEEAASTILTEISETVGARRASILVHDRATDTLQVVASLGGTGRPADIPVTDQTSVSARVFRTQHPLIVEREDETSPAEAPYRRGPLMSIPIMWTAPDGSQPMGVVNLSDRRSGQAFSAGDQKLVAAIATQIGTAIQNSRLVRASLEQQRLAHEMQLAHDLQMRLLPKTGALGTSVRVGARVVPAESVGGDFYNLFRLGEGRSGVMIGDVSSHGYRAALIMALAMSASAIHAQGTTAPGEMLNALLASLREELETTEMYISVLYAVLDVPNKVLRYANSGHPHAFVIGEDGAAERLPALDPPLGMAPEAAGVAERPWRSDTDLLLLFTDGISDARDPSDARLGEQAVLDVVCEHRSKEPHEIVERVFDRLRQHLSGAPSRDDLTLVVLRG